MDGRFLFLLCATIGSAYILLPLIFGGKLFRDRTDRTGVGTGSAGYAGVGVDNELLITLGDSFNGAAGSTCTALYASIGNLVCHYVYTSLTIIIRRRSAAIYIVTVICRKIKNFIMSFCHPIDNGISMAPDVGPFCQFIGEKAILFGVRRHFPAVPNILNIVVIVQHIEKFFHFFHRFGVAQNGGG